MPDLYDLKEIATALGLPSDVAARKRVYAIRDVLEKRNAIGYDPQRSNALGVTPEGLSLLQRANDYDGLSMADAAEQLRIELGDKVPPPDQHELRELKAIAVSRFEKIEEDISDLRNRLDEMEAKRPWWEKVARMLNPPRSQHKRSKAEKEE